MTHAVEFDRVTKRFGDRAALDDVTLAIPRRSIVGLLGRNGSGKTTLLRHITGLYLPTSGTCRTLGVDAAHLGAQELERIGVVTQHATLLGWMRVRQLVRYVASFYRTWDTDLEQHLIGVLDIDEQARVGTLSPGNAQKLGLVLATCHHPELLLLDEPLSDLDPFARRDVLAMLLGRFRTDEVTIVISSHLVHDIERVVDHVVCLDRGRVVVDAALDDLKERHGMNLEQIFLQIGGGASSPEATTAAMAGAR